MAPCTRPEPNWGALARCGPGETADMLALTRTLLLLQVP
jgi:hypothetical protein